MAYTTIDKPSDYFETKLYTGNGGTQSITGLDFQPNWVWIKDRDDTYKHILVDSVRGATKHLASSLTAAEITNTANVTSFTSDGFALSSDGNVNANADKYASWNWKAGTAFSNDASSTGIGSIDSTGSVNQTAGFSIVSFTGNATAGATIAHGLGAVPSWILLKDRDLAKNWNSYHKGIDSSPQNFTIRLNNTDAKLDTPANGWNDTAPTSSVFSIGDGTQVNTSGSNMIAYIFAEKQGYSKFGSYIGNGNADGTFVYTGFKPAFTIIKKTDTTNSWMVGDNKINPFNVTDNMLRADLNNAQQSGNYVDYLSNGFKPRLSGNAFNGSDGTYIYMAFAENPFVTSTGVPATAR